MHAFVELNSERRTKKYELGLRLPKLPLNYRAYAPINVNPVGGGGGSAGKGWGFDAWDYPRCRTFDRVKRV